MRDLIAEIALFLLGWFIIGCFAYQAWERIP